MSQLQININYCGICNLLHSLESEFSKDEIQIIRKKIAERMESDIILIGSGCKCSKCGKSPKSRRSFRIYGFLIL